MFFCLSLCLTVLPVKISSYARDKICPIASAAKSSLKSQPQIPARKFSLAASLNQWARLSNPPRPLFLKREHEVGPSAKGGLRGFYKSTGGATP